MKLTITEVSNEQFKKLITEGIEPAADTLLERLSIGGIEEREAAARIAELSAQLTAAEKARDEYAFSAALYKKGLGEADAGRLSEDCAWSQARLRTSSRPIASRAGRRREGGEVNTQSIKCSRCRKVVSREFPWPKGKPLIVRAWIECPECINGDEEEAEQHAPDDVSGKVEE